MKGGVFSYRNLHRNQRGFAIAAILYMLGLIGVVGGVLFSNNMQLIRSNMTVQNSLTVRSDLQAASSTLSAEAVFSTNNQTLCPPRSTHQTTGNPCAIAPVALVQFADFTGTQLPASYATASSSGSPVEVGVFAAGAGVRTLDAYGHTYIYCRWENARSTPASPAFVLLSAGPDGILQTKCGDTAALGDDSFVMLTVGEAINRAALWQSDTSNDVSYGATGSKVTIDSNGDLTAAGSINALSAAIMNGITASTLTTSGDIIGKNFTASGNVLGVSGSFTDLTSGSLTISGAATINGTTTLNNLSAGTSVLDSLSVTHNTTIGGGLTILGGDLVIPDGYSYAQTDSTGVARRLIAMSPENDVLLGGHNGTQNIYFLTNNSTVGWFDIEADFVALGNITGTNGIFNGVNTTNEAITGTLTVNNLALTGTTTAATGSFTNLNATNLTASNNVTAGNTVSGLNITASNNVSATGTISGVNGSFTGLNTANATISSTITAHTATLGSNNVTGDEVIGGNLSVMGGDLTLANDNSFAQYDNSGNARRVIALDDMNDLLVGGRGTGNIFFYSNGNEIGLLDTSGDFDVNGTVSGAEGSFANLTAGYLTINHYMQMPKNSSQPAACSSGNDGLIALTHTYTLCICNGGSSVWVKASDGTTSCAW